MKELYCEVTFGEFLRQQLRIDSCVMNKTAADVIVGRALGTAEGLSSIADTSEFDEIQIEHREVLYAMGIRELDIDKKSALKICDGRRAWKVDRFAPLTSFRLVTYPRSGSTWLRLMLGFLYVWSFENGRPHAQKLDAAAQLMKWSAYVVPHLYSKEARDGQHSPFPKLKPALYRVHRSTYTARYPKVIYLLRDGRDVVTSFWRLATKRKEPRAFTSIAEFLNANEQVPGDGWWSHAQRWLMENNHPDLLLVRFELLRMDPIKELTKITEFLGLDVPQLIIEKAVRLSSIEKIRPVWNAQVEPGFVGTGQIGSWRNCFTDEDKEAFKAQGQVVLEKMGYAKDDSW